MDYKYTDSQKNKLCELGISLQERERCFGSEAECDKAFALLAKQAAMVNRQKQRLLLKVSHQVSLCGLQDKLVRALREDGFTQVTTSTVVHRDMMDCLEREEDEVSREQVIWTGDDLAMRPTLTQNLYDIAKKLISKQGMPLKIFEIGACFRNETEKNLHLDEFTMLNLMEWNNPEADQTDRMKQLIGLVMEAAGIDDYKLEVTRDGNQVRGMDVMSENGIKMASVREEFYALGDDLMVDDASCLNLKVGLERVLMCKDRKEEILHYSKATSFLDGVRL